MKTRVISAIFIMLIFIPVLLLGGIYFDIGICLLAAGGLYELIKVGKTEEKLPIVMQIISYLVLIYICMRNINSVDFNYKFSYQMLSTILLIYFLPLVFYNDNNKYNIKSAMFLLGSVILLGYSFNLIIVYRNYEITRIIYLLLISTMTDTFAYITGLLIGTHKMVPKISPKKTIEGFIGGVLIGTIVSTAYYVTVINPSSSIVIVSLITMSLCVIGQLGDLVFSMIKRKYDVKDFSNLIFKIKKSEIKKHYNVTAIILFVFSFSVNSPYLLILEFAATV